MTVWARTEAGRAGLTGFFTFKLKLAIVAQKPLLPFTLDGFQPATHIHIVRAEICLRLFFTKSTARFLHELDVGTQL